MGATLQRLRAVGDDALGYEYEMIFPAGIAGIALIEDLIVRTQSITIPEQTVGEYEVAFKNRKMPKYNGKNETPNELTFSFRVDKYWLLYIALSNYFNTYCNQLTDFSSPDILRGGASLIRFPLLVVGVDANSIPTNTGWLFEGCYIKTLGGFDFSNDNGDPINIDVTVSFMRMLPPIA